MQRLLPTLIALGAGFLALVWGLFALERLIIEERDDARASVEAQRRALEEYARRTLEEKLREQLSSARAQVELAGRDPLVEADHLLLIDDGTQVLPRVIRYAPGDATPAKRLYDQLRDGVAPQDVEPDSPWADRLMLYDRFRDAVEARQRRAIESSFRAILSHRSQFVISSAKDLPFFIATLDYFIAHSDPSPDLLKALVRDGLENDQGGRLEGLQRLLLHRRSRLTKGDFEFLAARVLDLSERAATKSDDFRQRVLARGPPPLALEEPVTAPALVLGGAWYAESIGNRRVAGVTVVLPDLVADITRHMRQLALLEEIDTIVAGELSSDVLPLQSLSLTVRAPRFARALASIDQRFQLKTTFVVLTGGLALIIVVLALVVQSRRQRFVELKSDFVATVSHELRTPLASIRVMAETLERRTVDVPRVRDYPARIVREIDELSFLVENILSFNRIDKGRWTPRRSNVVLSEVLEEIRDELPIFSARPAELHVDGVDDIVLDADRELIKLLLRNLVKNACAYTERDPQIEVRARRTSAGLLVTVQDNGVGIPEGDQGRIFTDFFRAAHAGATRGSGLGLAICRKTMEAHGGGIRVASSGPEGTTFELTFPATAP